MKRNPAALAKANAFQFFGFRDIAEIFGLGADVLTECVRLGAPVVARKINPAMFMEWMRDHWQEIPKLS